jgi:MFS family permease
MKAYLELLRLPGAVRLIVSSAPARLSYAMSGLAVFFHVQQLTHSLSIAGFAVGSYSLVSSLTAAIRGHAVDRWGQTTPLALLVPGFAVACWLLGYVANDASSSIVLAGVMGLLAPPINLSIRPLWKELVSADQVRTAYALDSVMMNATSLIGPALGSWAALRFGGPLAMSITGGLMLIGGGALLSSKISREWVPEARVPGEVGIFKSPGMRLLAFEAILIGLGFGLLDVAIPSAASLADMAAWAAPSLGAIALGGLFGGIAAGSYFKNIAPARGLYLTSFAFSVVSVPLFLLPPGPITVVAMLILGLPIGATQVYYLEVVDMVRPRGAAVAAMGTMWTIEGSAVAAGNSLAGFISEHFSAEMAMIAIGPLLLAAASVLYVGSRGPLSLAMKRFDDAAENA